MATHTSATTTRRNKSPQVLLGYRRRSFTASASPTTATVNQNFTINGTLSVGTGGHRPVKPSPSRNSTDNATWNNVTTTVTDANGNTSSVTMSRLPNTYYYRTAYNGNATYTNATSNVVSVNVTAAPSPLTVTRGRPR